MRFLIFLAAGIASAQMLPGPGGNVTVSVSYIGPGDISSSASAWWGLRAYSAATRGSNAVRLCDAGDAHCADAITNASTGALVIPSSNPNCTSSPACTIKTFYDQSGNGLDVTQATEATRPVLTLSCLGSLPCATFTATQYLATAGTLSSVPQPYSSSWVANRSSSGTYQGILNNGTTVFTGFVSAATYVYINAGTALFANPATEAATHSIQGLYNSTSSKVNIDGTSATGDASTTALSGTLIVGDNSGGSLIGFFTEGGWWPSDVSANFTTMSTNQHSYWGY